MRKRLLIGIVIILCLMCILLCSAKWGYPALLTMLYGRQLEQALQRYWDVRRSPEAFRDPSRLSEVTTGSFLTSTMGLYSTFDEPPSYLSSCQVDIQFVEEYSQECARISARVVCGRGWSDQTGEYILLWEEGRWKVANFWQWIDTHDTFWPSSPPPVCEDFLEP